MEKAGAPPAAVAFARRVDRQGYLVAFRETGRVDVAFAEYPFLANENAVCLLVNGTPPAIDVDDLSGLDRRALAANPGHACRIVGEAQLRFEFDVEGRFRGVEIERVRPHYS